MSVNALSLKYVVDIRESKTLTAKAVPHAKGWVMYSSVSGSSSSSWGLLKRGSEKADPTSLETGGIHMWVLK